MMPQAWASSIRIAGKLFSDLACGLLCLLLHRSDHSRAIPGRDKMALSCPIWDFPKSAIFREKIKSGGTCPYPPRQWRGQPAPLPPRGGACRRPEPGVADGVPGRISPWRGHGRPPSRVADAGRGSGPARAGNRPSSGGTRSLCRPLCGRTPAGRSRPARNPADLFNYDASVA